MFTKKNNNRGSLTLEAAITIPIFLSVIISFSLIIKVIYTYEIMQNAISNTANELSTYSYLFHLTGIDGIDDIDVIEGNDVNANTENTENTNGVGTSSTEFLEGEEELKLIFSSIIKNAYDKSISNLFIPITKLCIKKHLVTDKIKNPDERLISLNIVGGFKGLDFSESRFFEDDNENINIVVKYKIDMPIPIKILPTLNIIQRASVRAWLGGDERLEKKKKNLDEEDVWNLDNFTRGRKIREQFGANLPFTFPLIAKFDYSSGTAIMIKSMDLTAASYQNSQTVSKTIKSYVNQLSAYKGQEVPWGKEKIIIRQDNVRIRQLTLVIPNNSITMEVELQIEWCKRYASDMGVQLILKKYGYKRDTPQLLQQE